MRYIYLQNWILNNKDGRIIGDIYNHGDWEDGKTIQTSPVVDVDGDVITTSSGSKYQLKNSYIHDLSDIQDYLMSTQTYSSFVNGLIKSGEQTLKDLTPETAVMIHMVMGISGEAGELLDAIKKYTIYTKPLDRENVIEELGDLEFFMEGLRNSLGITREETIIHNINKLSKRYSKGYSNSAAINRADKVALNYA